MAIIVQTISHCHIHHICRKNIHGAIFEASIAKGSSLLRFSATLLGKWFPMLPKDRNAFTFTFERSRRTNPEDEENTFL